MIIILEKGYKLFNGNRKKIEKVLCDENIQYLHMVLPTGEGLPEHYTNSNVYMTVIKGRLSIALGDEKANEYQAKTLITIPFNTKMKVDNIYHETLELIVVKAPAPKQ